MTHTAEVADMQPYAWLTRDDVLVTLVQMDTDMTDTTYLFQRVRVLPPVGRYASPVNPSALVVRFETCNVHVNGLHLPVGDGVWWHVLCTLADALSLAPNVQPGQSVTTRYEP